MLTYQDMLDFCAGMPADEGRAAREFLRIESRSPPAPRHIRARFKRRIPTMPTRPEPTDRDLLARADRRDVFVQTRHSALLEAVVAGCALIAQADGWITPEERRRMVAFLRQNNTLSAFGAEEALVLFEQLADRFLTDHDAAEARAFEAVQQVQDHPRHATLLMEACCQVALADGMFDGDERDTALRIARLLRVNPQRFELTAA